MLQSTHTSADVGPAETSTGEYSPPARASRTQPKPREHQAAGYFRWQPIFGWLVALCCAVPAVPIIALLAAIVRLTSKGPAFYAQQRVGKRGQVFRLYKLRSMRVDAEEETGPVWTDEDDPRITPVGRLLRRTHLDELPQLYNVLRGDMTLVGPRPERPQFVEDLSLAIPGYEDRHLVLPGITGLAQINLPPDTDYESVRRKLVLDLQYVQKATFWLDVRIMLCTSGKMLRLPGLVLARWLGIRTDPAVPGWMRATPSATTDDDGPTTYRRAVTRHLIVNKNGRASHPPLSKDLIVPGNNGRFHSPARPINGAQPKNGSPHLKDLPTGGNGRRSLTRSDRESPPRKPR